MASIEQLLGTVSGFLWGWPLIVLLFGTHLFLTLRLGFPQRHLLKAIRIDGEYFEPRLLLGALRYEQKQYRAAIPELEKSMELYPTKEAATRLSKSYEAIGDKAKAKKYADMVK